MKKRILALICSAALFGGNICTCAGFADMPENTNETRIVDILNKIGIMSGYEDGSFKPSRPVTRAEFAAILYKSIGYLNTSGSGEGGGDAATDGFDWMRYYLGSNSVDKKLIYPESEESGEDG